MVRLYTCRRKKVVCLIVITLEIIKIEHIFSMAAPPRGAALITDAPAFGPVSGGIYCRNKKQINGQMDILTLLET